MREWILPTLLAVGCASQPPPSEPATTDAEPAKVEVVLSLAEGAKPPVTVGAFACEAGAWASPRVVVVSCTPGDDPAAVMDALRAAPGVEAVAPNHKRSPR